MQFIQVAYCTTIPLLLIALWVSRKPLQKVLLQILAVSNFLLIGYSFFLLRQLVGLYRLSQQFQVSDVVRTTTLALPAVRLCLVIILPVLFLYQPLRHNRLLTLVILVLLYWNNPVYSWNDYDLFTKIPVYLSLFSSAYALLWLLKQLPHQSRKESCIRLYS
jgi:hypothetical protein